MKGETSSNLYQSVSKFLTRNSIKSLLYNIEIPYVPPLDSYREPGFFLRLPIFLTRKTMAMTKIEMMTAAITPMIIAAMFNESLSSVLFSDGSGSSMWTWRGRC